MYGWTGTVLRVDLTNQSYQTQDLNEELAINYIGGRGFTAKLLYDEVDPAIDAFDPKYKLIFATGPLTGTGAKGGCRSVAGAKAPIGNIGFATVGGHFGPEMNYAGYDVIIIEGTSSEPVYLHIVDDHVEFNAAADLWGKTVHETEDQINARNESPWQRKDPWKAKGTHGLHIASIGPAGENLCKVVAIMADKYNAFARTGAGAVMGSKKLKAIAIQGSKSVPIADPGGFKQALKNTLEVVKNNPLSST